MFLKTLLSVLCLVISLAMLCVLKGVQISVLVQIFNEHCMCLLLFNSLNKSFGDYVQKCK